MQPFKRKILPQLALSILLMGIGEFAVGASGGLCAGLSACVVPAYAADTESNRARLLQMRVFGSAPAEQDLNTRLTALEKYLIGKAQPGSDSDRLIALEQRLNGKAAVDDAAPTNDVIFDAAKVKEGELFPQLDLGSGVKAQSTQSAQSAQQNRLTPPEESQAENAPSVYSPDGRPVPRSYDLSDVNANLPVRDQIVQLEQRVYGHASNEASSERKLAALEVFAMGRAQSGDITSRLNHLVGALNGKPLPAVPQDIAAVVDPAANNSAPQSVPALSRGKLARPFDRRLQSPVSTLAAAYAAVGLILARDTLPTSVSAKIYSPAMKAGVAENDRLLYAELGVDTLSLAIDRNGERLTIAVPVAANVPVKSLVASPQNNQISQINQTFRAKLATDIPVASIRLSNPASKLSEWAVLKNYNIVVLLDTSGSMNSPAAPFQLVTRGEWSRQQIYDLAAEAEKLGSGAFDFGVFSSGFQIFPNCTAAGVLQILAGVRTGVGTNLADALQAAIDSRYAKDSSKPFLIVVITDAVIGAERQVNDMVVKAAQQARRSGDIKIVFLQIGNSARGQTLVTFLDTQPVVEGAPYDIVSSVDWPILAQIGLRSGLIAAMRKPPDNGSIADPVKAAAVFQMKASMDRQLERQLMRGNASGGSGFGPSSFGAGDLGNGLNSGYTRPNVLPAPRIFPLHGPAN